MRKPIALCSVVLLFVGLLVYKANARDISQSAESDELAQLKGWFTNYALLRKVLNGAGLVFLLGLLGVSVTARGQELDPAEIFETLRGFDQVYDAGWYVSGQSERLQDKLTPGRPSYPILFEFTLAPGRGAFYFEALEIPSVEPNPDGSTVRPFIRYSSYFDPEKKGIAGSSYAGSPSSYAPGMPFDESVEYVNISLAPVTSKRPSGFRKIELALGRGFTRYATGATKASVGENGLISLHLTSADFGPGEWRLSVDPEKGYLVREGHFFRDGADDAVTHVRNVGLFQGGEGIFVPESGFIENSTGIYFGTLPVRVFATKLEANTELLDTVKSHLDVRNFKRAVLMDDSGQKLWIETRDSSGRLRRVSGEGPPDLRPDMEKLSSDMVQEILPDLGPSEPRAAAVPLIGELSAAEPSDRSATASDSGPFQKVLVAVGLVLTVIALAMVTIRFTRKGREKV